MEIALKMPPVTAQQRFLIDDASKVGEARRAAQSLASFEFSAEVAGKVAIVATELANNLMLHAGGGELLLQVLGADEKAVLELLAIDKGPGMHDVSRCLQDGYSTSGTPGTGLGAVRRLASEFDIHSQPGEGTVVVARFGDVTPHGCYGVVTLALEGEIECGDAWAIEFSTEATSVMVVDGLGHGTFAAEAAQTAIGVFREAPLTAPQEFLTRANPRMSKTRGGAVACARIEGTRLAYAGLGNISGALVHASGSQGLVSHHGTMGMGQRRAQQFEYSCKPNSLLVMHSDGISARWELKNRPELMARHPAVIAGVIYRDHRRERDDATVLVLRT